MVPSFANPSSMRFALTPIFGIVILTGMARAGGLGDGVADGVLVVVVLVGAGVVGDAAGFDVAGLLLGLGASTVRSKLVGAEAGAG